MTDFVVGLLFEECEPQIFVDEFERSPLAVVVRTIRCHGRNSAPGMEPKILKADPNSCHLALWLESIEVVVALVVEVLF